MWNTSEDSVLKLRHGASRTPANTPSGSAADASFCGETSTLTASPADVGSEFTSTSFRDAVLKKPRLSWKPDRSTAEKQPTAMFAWADWTPLENFSGVARGDHFVVGCSGAEVDNPRELFLFCLQYVLKECFKLFKCLTAFYQAASQQTPALLKYLLDWHHTKAFISHQWLLNVRKRPKPTETPDGSAALKERKTPSDLCSGFHKVKHKRLPIFPLCKCEGNDVWMSNNKSFKPSNCELNRHPPFLRGHPGRDFYHFISSPSHAAGCEAKRRALPGRKSTSLVTKAANKMHRFN